MNGGDKFNRISCISRPFQTGSFAFVSGESCHARLSAKLQGAQP